MEEGKILDFPEIIESTFSEIVDLAIQKTISSYPRWSNWAGDLGFDCDTYHALSRSRPDLKPLPNIGLQKLFRASSLTEGPNLIFLQEAGIKIIEQARPFQWTKYQISGRIDAKCEIEISGKKIRMPLEHKALSQNMMRTVMKHKKEKIPLQKSRFHFLRKYPGQLQLYELMDNSEHGLWVYYDKTTGDFFFWYLPLDLEYAEELVQRAERCNQNVKEGRIPDPIRKDVCERCDFESTYCFTGKEGGEGFDFIDDVEWAEKLRRYYEINPIREEAEDLWDEIKHTFSGKNAIIGQDFKITSFLVKRKAYQPAPIAETEYYRVKVERLGK
jgi:hypothetical protein